MTQEKNINQLSDCRGSSLLGIAMTMLALGFLMTGAIYLYQNYDVIVSDQKSVDNTREIENALKNFLAMEGRLPCPAPLNAAPDSANFGKEDATCLGGAVLAGTYRAIGRSGATVRVGAVPVRTLNISDKMMMDGYQRRYVYAVTEKLASPTADMKIDEGAIYLNNQNGDPVSDQSGHIIYAVMTAGNDDRGSFDAQGQLVEACEGGTDAWNNCDFLTTANPDAIFMARAERAWGVGSTSFSHTFAFMASPSAYKWHSDTWSPCNGVCFSGDQNRPVNCRDYRSNVVADANCSHTPKPIDYRLCGLPPCYWDAGPWRNCTAGGGFGG